MASSKIGGQKMKRIVSVLLGVIMTLGIGSLAYASEQIGTVKYSKNIAYINNFPIPSYDYEGHTMIMVETLEKYGFDLPWEESTKTKCIIRGSRRQIDPIPTFAPQEDKIGKVVDNLYTTDVKIYLGNYDKQIPCYTNSTGYLFFNIDHMSYFGQVEKLAEENIVNVWVDDGLIKRETRFLVPLDPYPLNYYTEVHKNNLATFTAYGGPDGATVFVGIHDKNRTYYAASPGSFTITLTDTDGNKVYEKTGSFASKDYWVYGYFHNLTEDELSLRLLFTDINPIKEGKAMMKITIDCGEQWKWEYEQMLTNLPTL